MKVALVIGPTYREGSGVTPLYYARNDALALGKALRDVCGFARVTVLAGAGGGSSGAATRDAIIDQLERVADGDDEISHFVFAFSGHGRMRRIDTGEHYFLLPADARASNPGTFLDLATIRLSLERLLKRWPAALITVLLDCCRNDPDAGKGDVDNPLPLDWAKDLRIEPLAAARSGSSAALSTINACSPGERAYEYPQKQRGAFFHYFIEGIEQRHWQPGSLTVQDAFRYARDQLARDTRFPQTPTIELADSPRPAYLAELGSRALAAPPRRPWRAAGAGALVASVAALALYVERWPWLDGQICAWAPARCTPAESLIVSLSSRLHAAEARAGEIERARGQAEAELAAARAAATQAAQRAAQAEAVAVEAARARDAAQAEARQAAARAGAAEGSDAAGRAAREALGRAVAEAQTRAEAADRAKAAAETTARAAMTDATAARQAATEAASRQQAAEQRAATAATETAGLRRELEAARAEAVRLGQALTASEAAGREKDARIAELTRSRPAAPPPVPGTAPAAASGYPVPVGQSFRDCADCPEMVVIPAGRFLMGSPENEPGRRSNEGPQREVVVSRPLAVGKFEVTFAEWDACVAAGACRHRPGDQGWERGRQPVINVSWGDAQQYVRWLSGRTGRGYRLLTEAEWEYAARAGTTTPYSFGSAISPSQANFWQSGLNRTREVGSFAANRFGLHDMHGNVWEWVEDCYRDSYAGAPSDASQAVTSGGCSARVLRGGSWINDPQVLRAALRDWDSSGNRSGSIGFRLARTPGG